MKNEEDYLELERLSRKLGIPVPMTRLRIESKIDNNIIGLYDERSHSPVRNFYNAIFGIITNYTPTGSTYGAGYLTSKDINNTNRNRGFNTSYSIIGGLNTSTYGIIVGGSSTAESFEQYNLGTMIINGTSTNQLLYATQSNTTVQYTSGTKTWDATLTRIMNNNSPSTITVTESCINDWNSNNGLLMSCRDVISPSIDVLVGGQLTVTYTISLAYPA